MVLKRKNKISKRLKKGMRGGVGLFGFDTTEDWTTIINDWTTFINLLANYYFKKHTCSESESESKSESKSESESEKTEKNCGQQEEVVNITDEEYENALSNFLQNIEIIKRGKGTAFKQKSNKTNTTNTKEIEYYNCKQQDDEKAQDDEKVQDDEIIMNFDVLFVEILNEVKLGVNGNIMVMDRTDDYKSMIRLVNKLPNIKNSLDKLTVASIDSLNKRYEVILKLLASVCSGFAAPFCSGAASMLGENVYTLYIKLKENSKKIADNFCNSVLISFIKDVLPIMISKLKNINEFTVARNRLIQINKDLGLPAPAGGGKKSSRATHKEILGKQMKIYRKPNDKKEYVKHKGFLISTKEYKEHMKQGAAITKKVILGKERCIYKVQGSKQDHVKYKGSLIPVADYKKLMKA